MGEQSARGQSEDRSSDQTSKAEQNAAETERASGAGRQEEFVSYSTERKAAKVSARYDIDVNKGEAQRLQRLEAEHGSKRVSSWVDEGMPVKAMGKPRDMEAFREQQADGASEESGGAGSGAAGGGAGNRNGRQGGGERGQARASAAETVGNVVSSSGQSLDEGVRQEMEAKMGGDFSDVQVHTGSDAAVAADAINARAFTVGNHVAFNKGEYQPGTEEGNKVLAHELTHARQQTAGDVSMLPKPDSGLVVDPDPQLEREAVQTAAAVTDDDGDRTVHRHGAEVHVQRLPAGSTVADTGDGDATTVQRAAGAESANGEGVGAGGGGVATVHKVSQGETLSGIAAEHGIDDWQTLWQQNRDVVGDQPNLIFPGQQLEIPEGSGPEANLPEPEGEMTPAPKNDMRTEQPEETPPEAQIAGEEGPGGPLAEEEPPGSETPERQGEAAGTGESGGGGVRTLGPGGGAVTDLGEIPESSSDSPSDDPALSEMLSGIDRGIDGAVGEDVGEDGSGETEAPDLADNAGDAAEKPSEEDDGEDQTEHLTILDEEQSAAPDFDKGAFASTLETRVDDATPDTIEDLEAFGDDGSLDELEGEMEQEVAAEKESTEGGVVEEAEQGPPETPDEREDVPLDEPETGPKVAPDSDAGAAARPQRRSKEDLEQPMDEVKADIDEPLEDEPYDETDIAASPHDELSEQGKRAAEIKEDADRTKTEFREQEAQKLTRAEEEQAQLVEEGTQALNQQRESQVQAVAADQRNAKSEDESVRQEVFSRVNEIYDQTESRVTDALDAMEEDVKTILNEEFSAVRQQFEQDVEQAKEQSTGFASWFKRTFFLGDDMKEHFERARQNFVDNTKSRVIDAVADRVAQGMREVGEEIKKGQKEVEEYLNGLTDERQQVAQEAAQMMNEKFTGLKQQAEQAKEAIADDVISTYEQQLDEIETELAEAKKEVEEARWDFTPGFVETIAEIGTAFSTLVEAFRTTISSVPSLSTLWNIDFGELLEKIGSMVEDVFDYFTDWANVIKTMFMGLLKWLDFGSIVDGFEDISLPEGLTDIAGITAMGWDIFTGLIGGDYLQEKVSNAWSDEEINVGGRVGSVGVVDAFFELLNGGTDIINEFSSAVAKVDENVDTSLLELAKGVGLFGVSLFTGATDAMKRGGKIVIQEIMQSSVVSLLDAVLEAAVSFVSEQVIKIAVSKLSALAGPVGAALELIENVYKFLMFIIENAAGAIGMIQSFVQGVFGLIKSATSRAANLVIDGLQASLPMLFDFIAKAIAGTGVGDKIRNIFMKGKEKVDEFFEWAASSLEPVLKPITEVLYPIFFGSGLTAEEEEDDSSSGSRSGSGSGGRSGGGKYENLDEKDWSEMSASQKATYAMDQGTTALQIGMGEKVKIKDPDSGEEKVVEMDDLDDDKRERLDQESTRNVERAEAISGFDDMDLDTGKIGLENKMYIVDLTVLADQGSISAADANQILTAAGLTDLVQDEGLDPVEFLTQDDRPKRIRTALVEHLAGELDPEQVKADVDEVEPEHVWDESELAWKLDYQTIVGQAAEASVQDSAEGVS